jgi:hypothetical protein
MCELIFSVYIDHEPLSMNNYPQIAKFYDKNVVSNTLVLEYHKELRMLLEGINLPTIN